MKTFRELFEVEVTYFDREVMSLENKIIMSKDDNEKLQLHHQLKKATISKRKQIF